MVQHQQRASNNDQQMAAAAEPKSYQESGELKKEIISNTLDEVSIENSVVEFSRLSFEGTDTKGYGKQNKINGLLFPGIQEKKINKTA